MHNLNLYSYYDKSLADVNRESLEALNNKPKRVSKKKLNKKIIIAATVALVSGLSVAMYLGIFSEKIVEIVETPPPIDTRTEEEKQGYVQIQIFEFADTSVETVAEPSLISNADDGNIKADKTTMQIAKTDGIKKNTGEIKDEKNNKVEENKKQTVSVAAAKQEQKKDNKIPAPTQVVAPVVKTYSILFENIDEKEYDRIKNISEKNNTKLELVDTYSNYYSVWKVYEKSDTGNEIFGLEKVNHIEDFLTQNDAVEYATKRNLNALIKQVGVTEKTYTARLCCSELEKAKQIAQNSNITDKIIKIIRAE